MRLPEKNLVLKVGWDFGPRWRGGSTCARSVVADVRAGPERAGRDAAADAPAAADDAEAAAGHGTGFSNISEHPIRLAIIKIAIIMKNIAVIRSLAIL